MIGAVWDARGTEEIARALKGVDSGLDILQRRRPWDAVACERHGKLQSAYSDDSTQLSAMSAADIARSLAGMLHLHVTSGCWRSPRTSTPHADNQSALGDKPAI